MFFFKKKVKCCRYFIVLPVNDILNVSDTDKFVYGLPGLVVRKVELSTFTKHRGLKYYCESISYELLNTREHIIELTKAAREDILNLIFDKPLRKKIESSDKNIKIGRMW